MRWAMRLDGTIKHLPVCGGGRLYLHTAEGQILAVEQDTDGYFGVVTGLMSTSPLRHRSTSTASSSYRKPVSSDR